MALVSNIERAIEFEFNFQAVHGLADTETDHGMSKIRIAYICRNVKFNK